jgi:hypothetical protein
MIEHISLIIAQIADRILTKMRVIKGKYLQIWQSIQIEYLFETANFVSTDVQVCELD